MRRILNFGHTYGHAIEAYKSFRHGYAVASGIELASRFSLSRRLITSPEYERIVTLLKAFRLLRRHDIPDDQISRLVMRDKKKTGSDVYFIFIERIGKAVAVNIPLDEVIEFYRQSKPGN